MMRAFVRFCLVGGTATAIQYLVMIALVHLADMNATLASGIGFCLSAVFNYLLTRSYVFGSERAHTIAASRYLGMVLIGLLINSICMAVLQWVGLNYLASQVLTTIVLLTCNFTLASSWVFGQPAGRLP